MLEPFAFPRHTGPPLCERHLVSDCPRALQCPSVNESCPLVFDDGRPEPKVSTHLAITRPHESLDRYWLFKASQGEALQLKNLWKLLGVFLTILTNISPIFLLQFPYLNLKASAHPLLSTPVFLNILFQVSDAF